MNSHNVIKIIGFWLLVISILFLWRVFNDFGIELVTDALDNQSGVDPHPFPLLDTIFGMIWGFTFIIAIFVTAVSFYGDET